MEQVNLSNQHEKQISCICCSKNYRKYQYLCQHFCNHHTNYQDQIKIMKQYLVGDPEASGQQRLSTAFLVMTYLNRIADLHDHTILDNLAFKQA